MDFDQKAQILSDLMTVTASIPEWDNFRNYANLGLPFAFGHTNKMITLKKDGKDFVTDAYNTLLEVLNLEDIEYANVGDMFDKAISQGAKAVEASESA